MSKFLSKKFDNLEVYVPGEQPLDKEYIKLNTNESPFSPSEKVIEAIAPLAARKLNLYSDPTCGGFIKSLTKAYNRRENEIFVGNGSDEVLAFIFNAFCDDKKGMAFPEIGYGFYPVFCQMLSVECQKIALNDDFSIDISRFFGVKNNIIIANPNAQTGLYLSVSEIRTLLEENFDRLIIIDEAYIDFGGASAISLFDTHKNLIIVSTLSKSRQLAGARLGYAFAAPDIIDDLNKMKYGFNPYNVNSLGLLAASAAIDDTAYFDYTRNIVIENREFLSKELKKIGFFVTDSLANFVLAKLEGIGGKELYLSLKEKGVLVRFLSDEKLKDYVRITVGSRKQMEILIEKIREIKAEKRI